MNHETLESLILRVEHLVLECRRRRLGWLVMGVLLGAALMALVTEAAGRCS